MREEEQLALGRAVGEMGQGNFGGSHPASAGPPTLHSWEFSFKILINIQQLGMMDGADAKLKVELNVDPKNQERNSEQTLGPED